ncbi:TPA: hypothetical protein ACUI23_001479 [Staphylococcus pseudintermedius]
MTVQVADLSTFEEALNRGEKDIEIIQSFLVPYSIHLSKGVSITGSNEKEILISFSRGDGFSLEGDNKIKNLAIQANQGQRAIFINSKFEDLGEIELSSLTITGQVQMLTRRPQKKLNLVIHDLDIVSADTRIAAEKPLAYGVSVYQGALTIYNYNQDPDSLITANIDGVSVGREKAPVIGTGIFIAGFGYDGGKVEVENMKTHAIYSNGMIPFGQPTLITGGIFIVSGAHAQKIESVGPITTYGVNDMVIDVWGEVDEWTCFEAIRSYGTSGIGFVNFGTVHNFVAKKPVETYGSGARGFNQYDGTIDNAEFDSIITYGDGSIGMQFSKPVGNIKINKHLKTYGRTGESLVKGQIQNLDAIALSIKAQGEIKDFRIDGDIQTHGDDILALSIEDDGKLSSFEIGGNIMTSDKTRESVDLQPKAIIEEATKNLITRSIK